MMFRQIKFVVFKTDFLLCLKEDMQVFGTVCVILLGNYILCNVEFLLQVGKASLGSDLTFGVGQKPTFSTLAVICFTFGLDLVHWPIMR